MATDVQVPALGESITEGTLAQWLKKPGEAVAADEPIASLETDKVSVEVPSPASGTLAEIYSHPISYAIDDVQGFSNIHNVIGSSLYKFHWKDHYYHGVTVDMVTILSGLQQVTPDQLPFDLKISP